MRYDGQKRSGDSVKPSVLIGREPRWDVLIGRWSSGAISPRVCFLRFCQQDDCALMKRLLRKCTDADSY